MGIKKIVLMILGFIFLGLGAVGIVIPVMPTTPFVLLAAGCFSVGSRRIHDWLNRSPFFGPYLENYRTGAGVEKRLKIISILFVWTGLIISMLIVRTLWICLLLGGVGAGVTIHLLLIRTKR